MQPIIAFVQEQPIQQVVTSTITRPADETQYAVGDVLSASDNSHFEIDLTRQRQQQDDDAVSGVIYCARLGSDNVPGTGLACDLHIWSSDPGDLADNVPADWTLAELFDRANRDYWGYISIAEDGWATIGSTGVVQDVDPICKRFITGTDGKLYIQPVLRNTYTPANGEELSLTFGMVLNKSVDLDPWQFLKWVP